jgi:hypothetical protein
MTDKNKRLNTSDGLLKAWREATGGTDTAKDSHKEFLSSLEQAKLRAKPDPALAKWREASLFGKSPDLGTETPTQDTFLERSVSLFDEGEGEV